MNVLQTRKCYGCGQTDDHPRFTRVVNADDASKDELYHYDCIPAGVRDQHGVTDAHPGVAATIAGKRGQDVRDAVVDYARARAAQTNDKEGN